MCIQVKDSITIKGTKYSLYATPLNSYWTRKNPKPETRLTRTTCWRGYVASWEIRDNCLYLTDILYHTPYGDAGLKCVFPSICGKIKADWYTGELKIPVGNELFQEYMEDPVYEYDLLMNIKKGNLISQRYRANY